MSTQGWFAIPIYVTKLEHGLFRNVQKEKYQAWRLYNAHYRTFWNSCL